MTQPRHIPRFTGFAAKVRRSFALQDMMRTIGAELVTIEPGHVIIAAPIRDALRQQHGFAHAALTFAIGDSAAGYAALSLMSAENEVLTVEMKINLLAPARGDALLAKGRVLRPGRRLLTVASDIFGEPDGVHVATMLGTMMASRPDR
jgi:uncharacterized protein (TIGR00369 family)